MKTYEDECKEHFGEVTEVVLQDEKMGFAGYQVKYAYESHTCDVTVWELVSTIPLSDTPIYQRKDSDFSPDMVEDDEDAERYLTASFKWDGCLHIRFFPDLAENMAGEHMCGPDELKRHCALLEILYKRSHDLMLAGHEYGWDD